MPTWSTSLPPLGKHQGFDLRRTPANAPLLAIVTCETLHACDTHYWHGRTQPCERTINAQGATLDDSQCPACQDKQAWRTHAYVSCFDAKRHEHFLFECTANAAKPLEEYLQATGTLRGCIITATRPKGGKNSKVVLMTGCANLSKIPLPTAPDVQRALAIIWRLPAAGLDLERRNASPASATAATPAVKRMKEQVDNAMDSAQIEQRRQELLDALNQPDKKNGKTKAKEVMA